MTRRPSSQPPHLGKLALGFMLAGALCIGYVFCAGCSLRSQQVIHVGVQSADLVSTYYGEQAGGYEANPFAPDAWAGRIAIKAAVTAGVVYMTHRLEKAGYGSMARNLLMTVNALIAGVVINNVMVTR